MLLRKDYVPIPSILTVRRRRIVTKTLFFITFTDIPIHRPNDIKRFVECGVPLRQSQLDFNLYVVRDT